MKISRFLVPTFLVLLASGAAAQDNPNNPLAPGDVFGVPDTANGNANNGNANNGNGMAPNALPAAPAGAARVTQVDAADLANLPALLGQNGGPGAISLRASEAEFAANPAAAQALLAWVNGGGTVFLHTGAARAFGFETVEARLGTNAQAGQLFGRARSALPYGAHPLLWDDGQSAPRRAPGTDLTQFPGVGVVFYQLRPGDHLVVSHPAGTPLLLASDLAGDGGTPLYAAALAPFGRGFAVFTPDYIEQRSGDGALFARNLLKLAAPAFGGRPGALAQAAASARLVGVPASVIENGAAAPAALQKALVAAGGAPNGAVTALPAFGTAPAMAPQRMAPVAQGAMINNAAPNEAALPGDALPDGVAFPAMPRFEAVVLLSRAEAGADADLIAAGGDRAGAVINLLRARLFMSRGDVLSAGRALEAGAELAPDSAELTLWRAILQLGAAQNLNQPAPARAELVRQAALDVNSALSQAANGDALVPTRLPALPQNGGDFGNDNNGNNNDNNPAMDDPQAPMGNAGGGATLAGFPIAALRNWSVKLPQIAQVFSLEPPFVQQFGLGSGAITVRGVAGDETVRLILPGIRALANARNLGWHGDSEEVLFFPTAESYLVYRHALGLNGPTAPLPAGTAGDVVGQRISMIASLGTPTAVRDPVTGQSVNFFNHSDPSSTLARLHSYVLLGAYDESALSPVWLQLGLENLSSLVIGGDTTVVANGLNLRKMAETGGLLTPQQFNRGLFNNQLVALSIAQAQAASIMDFFYRAYGAGAVTETVQRLGAGQNIDDALVATTQGDELALFRNWRTNTFGPFNFPNAG